MRFYAKILPILFALVFLSSCHIFSENDGSSSENQTPTTVSSLPADLEKAFGADPTKEDTDGDGLKDEFEIKNGYPLIKPDSVDTDNNGITDDKEDIDGDGLTSSQEQQYSTDNLSKDSDNDELSDYAEIFTYKTDPNKADTDGDSILDGREIANGSDPLVSDPEKIVTSKNTDHVIDPNTGEETKVFVSITGAGDIAGKLEIKGASDTKVTGQVGKQYDLTFDGADLSKMQSAEVTLPYDPLDSEAVDPSQLVVAAISPTTGVWELLPSTVDYTNNTITATTTHFSNYTILNSKTYMEYVSKVPQTCDYISDPDAVPADVALVIDSSGSMSWNDPNNIRLSAAKSFVSNMKATDRVAVVDFDGYSRLATGLTSDQNTINTAIDTIDSSGGTNIGGGVSVALQQLKNSDKSKIRAIILLTDGDGDYDANLTTELSSLGIRVFTIGLGSSVNTTLLTSIAESTGGKYKQINDASGLVGIFKEFASVFGDDGTDDDKDGLTNCQEIQGIYTSALGIVKTDPNKSDSDDDGLLDSIELDTPRHSFLSTSTPWVSTAYSNPNTEQSDTDNISDYDEFDEDTNPLSADTDGDSFTDSDELENGSDPNDKNDPVEQKPVLKSKVETTFYYGKKVFEYATGTFLGATVGEWTEIDTFAEFTGLTVMNFVPTCGASDLSNAVAEYVKGDYINGSITLTAAGSGGAECVGIFVTALTAGGATPVVAYTIASDGGTALARQVAITAKFIQKLGASEKVIAKFYRELERINIGGITVDDILVPVIKQLDADTFNRLVKSGLSESDSLKAMAGMLKKGTYAQKLGKTGETAVRAIHNIGEKPKAIPMNGRMRIPDGINKTEETLNEVKNVKYQGLTQQLKDYLDYSQAKGLKMVLWVRQDTILSKPLEDLIKQEKISRGTIP